eukprot:TRINITY_DN17992_c0_g1_i2.p1 TRINITY_DN17992_c0_g1~~TRINITY_DN17992_c0_g1_i2.p1  ORF type:complete len:270 (-),score=60.42 TRINITY_DN17992_c0_g1_i2:164-898(-)
MPRGQKRQRSASPKSAGSSPSSQKRSPRCLKGKAECPKLLLSVIDNNDGRFFALSGKTYDHKESLRSAGAFWHSASRSWRFPASKRTAVKKLLRLDTLPKINAGSSVGVELPEEAAEKDLPEANDIVKVQVLEEHIGLVVVLKGNTFRFKDEIKDAGGFWCKPGKCWMFGPGHFSQARRLLRLKRLPRDHGWETQVDLSAALEAAAAVKKMTIPQLQAELRSRGKATKGRKAELLARLLKAIGQ